MLESKSWLAMRNLQQGVLWHRHFSNKLLCEESVISLGGNSCHRPGVFSKHWSFVWHLFRMWFANRTKRNSHQAYTLSILMRKNKVAAQDKNNKMKKVKVYCSSQLIVN